MATYDSTPNSCCVYVIVATSGAVKIGITSNVDTRLKELQTGNHEQLSVLYKLEVANRTIATAIESLLHDRYARHALRGEWFSVDADRLVEDIRFVSAFAKLVRSASVEMIEEQEVSIEPPVIPEPEELPDEPATPQKRPKPSPEETTQWLREKGTVTPAMFMDTFDVQEKMALGIFKYYVLNHLLRPLWDEDETHVWAGD